jgi:nitroreductase
MDVQEAIKKRYSVRSYQNRPVDEKLLRAVLEAARLAPSASNVQEWRFVVVRDATIRQSLMKAAHNQPFVGQAPVVIAACAILTDKVMPCGQPAYPIDIAIAVDHMTLAAVELGLGTCWVGAFDEAAVKQSLGVPATARVVVLMTLGYSARPSGGKSRKSFEQIVAYEKYAG